MVTKPSSAVVLERLLSDFFLSSLTLEISAAAGRAPGQGALVSAGEYFFQTENFYLPT